jgi:Fe-S-cluster containining protein
MAPKPKITGEDCRSCGACCLGGLDDGRGWADCTVEDVKRMTAQVRAQLVSIKYGSWIHTEARAATPTTSTKEFGEVCSFLRGTPGKRVSCRIYETRPDVCRNYKPGSLGCREAREQIGLPA